MTLKAYLSQCRELNKVIDNKTSLLNANEKRREKAQNHVFALERIEKIRQELEAEIFALFQEREEIALLIAAHEDSRARSLLQKHYLWGETLGAIGREWGVYRGIFHIHNMALKNLEMHYRREFS
jgi:hypothetical protein